MKIIMKISKNKNIFYLITSFNQLHGYLAIRITYHTTLQATPCQLVIGRDMIHNIAFRANWDRIQKRKQDIINKSNHKEQKNKSLIPYEHGLCQLVFGRDMIHNIAFRPNWDKIQK
jgi:hypothetical protein